MIWKHIHKPTHDLLTEENEAHASVPERGKLVQAARAGSRLQLVFH